MNTWKTAVCATIALTLLPGRLDAADLTRAKTLTAAVAGELAAKAGGLRLQVTELPADVAAALAASKGTLGFEALTSLSPQAAAALAAHTNVIDLPKVASLTPDAAKALAGTTAELALAAVTELPAAVAAELAAHKGMLAIGVTELSDEAAAALAKHGGQLRLDGLKSLTSLPLAERLGRQEWLFLNSVTRITPEIAKAICPPENRVRFKDHVQLYIGLTELSPEVAAAIMAGRGHISANSLEAISDEAAAAWAGPFANIRLFGLKKISPAAAAALATGGGIFDIRAFGPEFDDETAAALAKQMRDGPCRMVDLNGLKKLSSPDLAIVALRRTGQGPHSTLNGVAEITPAVAAAIAGCKENLNPLPGLTSLTSAPVAAKYAAQSGNLTFKKLATIPDDVAVALATHKGNLDLSGLQSLSDDAAKALARHDGPVILSGLTTVSEAGLTALRANDTIVLPANLTKQ